MIDLGAIAGFLGMESEGEILRSMGDRAPGPGQRLAFQGGVFLHRSAAGSPGGLYRRGENSLCWSGRLFNLPELSRELHWEGTTQGELMLLAYETWGRAFLKKLNGVFSLALWDGERRELMLARDRIGVKPLYYYAQGDRLIFGSEAKNILAAGIRPQLTREGAAELVLLGPGRIPGSGVFRGIRSLEPGYYGVFSQEKKELVRYWHLEDREHREDFPETAEHVSWLLEDSLRRQMPEGEYGCFLSGGLDSSLLTALCRKIRSPETWSVDYQNSSRDFTPGEFEPESDGAYIAAMVKALDLRHTRVELTPEDLIGQLEKATRRRDLPGMGDVDFSLMAFCSRVTVPTVFSGECADEVFGGYPWYRDPELRNYPGFPWARNLSQRLTFLGWGEEMVKDLYADTLRDTDVLPGNPDRRIKEMVNLNFRWFMQTLLERNDRMRGSLEILVPFCDYRIAEYLYGVPWEMKNHLGREKGLLRECARGLVPEQVRLRKKSPYPKTFDPQYESIVTARLRRLLSEDRPLWHLLRKEAVRELLTGESLTPWYGQLMRRPQTIAWILQTDWWLTEYQVNFTF